MRKFLKQGLILLQLQVVHALRALGLYNALTFDDILERPGYTDFSRSDVDLTTRLAGRIELRLPVVSAPMDKVTEWEVAAELAKIGGIGFIHRNLTIDQQVKQVKKVKDLGLLVGAAIAADPGYMERVVALVKVGRVDVLLIDSAHGHNQMVIDAIREIKRQFPEMPLIAGNVATYEGTKALAKAGADAIRVGMGPGSICTTRIVSGMGVPQITALLESVWAAFWTDTPVIADGGIRYSGDMTKALANGASTVMLGSMLASAVEAPGKIILLTASQIPSRFKSISGKVNAMSYLELRERFPEKAALIEEIPEAMPYNELYCFHEYRGMGSVGAMEQGATVKSEGEFHGKSFKNGAAMVAEGVEALVPIKGSVTELVEQWIGGIKSGMFYLGCRTIPCLWRKARFDRVTAASQTESHPHDVVVTNAGKSYS